jgi:3-hydroxyisobutyrate dehydrogenase-like beta-hydroxyacid dehydrogenase
MSPKPTIGFIGLGTIGLPMASNLLKAGYLLRAHDLNPIPIAEIKGQGAAALGTPAEVAADSDVVVTMVPDAPDVEQVALGPQGIIHGIRPGSIYMDMSTIDPGTTRRVGAAIRAKGARMVDCPVARSVDEARAGKLAIMMGGEPADVEAVQPILHCLGDTFTYCGPLGSGVAMKLVNNYISASIIAIHAEALSFGVKAGLTLENIMRVVGGTFAGTRMLSELLPAKAFKGDFRPGFFTRLSRKDVRLGLTLAREMGVETPVGRGVYETLEQTCAAGHATSDLTSMLCLREEQAGVRVRLTSV